MIKIIACLEEESWKENGPEDLNRYRIPKYDLLRMPQLQEGSYLRLLGSCGPVCLTTEGGSYLYHTLIRFTIHHCVRYPSF